MKNILIYSVIIVLIAVAFIGGCNRGSYKQGVIPEEEIISFYNSVKDKK